MVYPLTRCRSDEERERRRLHGDAGAKFQSKVPKVSWDGVFKTVTTAPTLDVMVLEVYSEGVMAKKYRIRKLTPRECFRLMDVPEDAIDKIQATGVSSAQQYKMAGNSIVVSCLEHIFRELFITKTPSDRLPLF